MTTERSDGLPKVSDILNGRPHATQVLLDDARKWVDEIISTVRAPQPSDPVAEIIECDGIVLRAFLLYSAVELAKTRRRLAECKQQLLEATFREDMGR